jgi:putative tricarboxylic transport membrane protein
MNPSSLQKSKGYLIVGGVGLVFSVGYLGMSIPFPLGELDQPGAGVFTLIVGAGMILASLATLWEGWQMDKAAQVDLLDGTDRKRLFSLLGLLFGYILMLPWLGMIIVTMLFCVLLLRVLSDLGWLRILAYSVMISASFYVVFVALLKVPMPRGMLVF